jgi:hypothetical protein
LQDRLRQLDGERGWVTGGPAFGVVEVECHARVLLELAPFEFLTKVIDWFWDNSETAQREPQNPAKLYPYRPKVQWLAADIGDAVGGAAVARLARAVKELADPQNRDESRRQVLDAWLGASADVVRTVMGDGAVPLLRRPPAADFARRLLDRALTDLGASGYMMCVRDPVSEDDYRIVATRNLKYPEMVSGFTGFNSAQWKSGPADEVYCTNSNEAFENLPKNQWFLTREGKQHWVKCARLFTPKTDGAPLKKDDDGRLVYGPHGMYGPYFVREGLSGLACLHGRGADGKRCLSLYLNFTREVAFGTRVRAYLRALKADLTQLYDQFCEEFCAPVDSRLADRLLQTAAELAELPVESSKDDGSFEEALVGDLTKFLESVLELLSVDLDRGLATLDRFNSNTYSFSPVTHVGTAYSYPGTLVRHSDPLKCEDAIAWVAIHRRPILVPRVTASHLAGFHKPIDPDVKSRLVVPMFAGLELFAVLNVESHDEGAFTPGHLALLSLVANPIARAWRGCCDRRREAADLTRMYEVLRALRQDGNRAAAKCWCEAVKEAFRAVRVLMWHVNQPAVDLPNSYSSAFEPCDADECPQPGGWTDYVAKHRQVVCLTDITPGNYTQYRKLFWDCDPQTRQGHWKEIPANCVGRMKLSKDRTGPNTLCLIGVPLINETRCFAVVWLLYEDNAPRQMFASRLIRDAYLVPFFSRPGRMQKFRERSLTPVPLDAAPGTDFSRNPFPVLNPKYAAQLLDMVREPVPLDRDSGRPTFFEILWPGGTL